MRSREVHLKGQKAIDALNSPEIWTITKAGIALDLDAMRRDGIPFLDLADYTRQKFEDLIAGSMRSSAATTATMHVECGDGLGRVSVRSSLCFDLHATHELHGYVTAARFMARAYAKGNRWLEAWYTIELVAKLVLPQQREIAAEVIRKILWKHIPAPGLLDNASASNACA